MIDVRTLYKEEEGNYGWYDYQPMVEAFGNVVVQVDDDDYQGDTRVLYDNNGKIGHLVFGWGSCSGCDALQACETLDEVQELCNMLENSIIWFDSKAEALKWFETHDWEGSWEWYYEKTKKYVNLSIKYLEGKIMTNLYYIENCGCDDTTRGLAIIPDEFWDIFKTTIENLNENSSYCCMPRIAVYKIDETMIREAIEEDIDYEVMYLNDSKYVLNSPLLSNMRVI